MKGRAVQYKTLFKYLALLKYYDIKKCDFSKKTKIYLQNLKNASNSMKNDNRLHLKPKITDECKRYKTETVPLNSP